MDISLNVILAGLSGFILTLTRVSAALLLFPLPGVQQLFSMGRIVLILGLTISLEPTWPALAASSAAMGMPVAFWRN